MPKSKTDIDLLKIQLLSDTCQTIVTFQSASIIAIFVGLYVLVMTLRLEKAIDNLSASIISLLLTAFTGYFVYSYFKDYWKRMKKLDYFLMLVERGEALPSLDEMTKMKIPKSEDANKEEKKG